MWDKLNFATLETRGWSFPWLIVKEKRWERSSRAGMESQRENWCGRGRQGQESLTGVVRYCCFIPTPVLAAAFLLFAPMAEDALGFQPSAAGNGVSRATAFLPLLFPAPSPNCLIVCWFWLFCDNIHLSWSHTSQAHRFCPGSTAQVVLLQ